MNDENKIPMTPSELLTEFLDQAHRANYSVSQANLAKEALEKAFKAGARAAWQAGVEGPELTQQEKLTRDFYKKMKPHR